MKKIIPILVWCTLIIIACKQHKKSISNTNDFLEYINFYPEEIISTSDKIRIQFIKPITVSAIPENVISMTPKVDGTIEMKGNTLVFSPKEKLQNNQDYTASVNLSKIYSNVQEKNKVFVFKFRTKEQLFVVNTFAVQNYDRGWNYIAGTIDANDVLETKMLPKVLQANYNGKNIPIQFDVTEKLATKISFTIDSIERLENDGVLQLIWNGSPIESSSKGKKDILIIGKNNFKVTNVEVFNKESQHIEISFSDPIDASQNLNGLIAFKNAPNAKFTYTVSNNIVNLYPKKTFKETVEIEIFSGIKNIDGYRLKENTFQKLFFEQPKPTIQFLQSGTILPTSNNLKINFSAINLRAVDITVYKIFKDNILQFLQTNNLESTYGIRNVGKPVAKQTINLANRGVLLDRRHAFAVDLAEIIVPEAGAMYRVALDFNKDYTNYQCNGTANTKAIIFGKKEIENSFYNGNQYATEYQYENYNWNERDNPCNDSFYYNKTIRKNIIETVN